MSSDLGGSRGSGARSASGIRSLSAVVALVSAFLSSGCEAQPHFATGADADITADGLHQVDPSLADGVWVRLDLDLAAYSGMFLVPAGVLFRPVEPPRGGRLARDLATDFPVANDMKARMRAHFGAAFGTAMLRLVEIRSHNRYRS